MLRNSMAVLTIHSRFRMTRPSTELRPAVDLAETIAVMNSVIPIKSSFPTM